MLADIAHLFHGFAVVLQPSNILLMVIGILLGVIVGVLPGLGGANGIAILLPLTFSMTPTGAIIMLSCIYWGALFGGAITSVLFNIPGEPWSVATTFDGYPMAQQGRAGEALTAAFTSSFVGALFAVIVITLVAPLVADFALEFGPAKSRHKIAGYPNANVVPIIAAPKIVLMSHGFSKIAPVPMAGSGCRARVYQPCVPPFCLGRNQPRA